MSALDNRRCLPASTGPREASSVEEDSVGNPYMEILRPKRFLPDENLHHDDDDAVTSPAHKKRAVVGASFPLPSTSLPYPSPPTTTTSQYSTTLPSLSLPKINPVVLVLKKRPLDVIPETAPPNTPQNPTRQQFPQQPHPLTQQPQQQTPRPTPPVLQSEKLQSVLRGLVHVAQCPDGCSNKLCQSTSGFVTKVRSHLTSQPSSHDRSGCGACKLWKSIVDEHRKDCLDPHCSVPLCKRTLYM